MGMGMLPCLSLMKDICIFGAPRKVVGISFEEFASLCGDWKGVGDRNEGRLEI